MSGPYAGCNDHHLAELLALREGIILSRKSVERIRREAGLKATRQRRPPKHRQRRERMSQEGMLLQVDGSMRGSGQQRPETGALWASTQQWCSNAKPGS